MTALLFEYLTLAAIAMPCMLMIEHAAVIARNGRLASLSLVYLAFCATVVAFSVVGPRLYFWHLLVECVLVTAAVLLASGRESGRLHYPQAMIFAHFFLLAVLLASAMLYVLEPNLRVVASLAAVVVSAGAAGWVVWRSEGDQRLRNGLLVGSWALTHAAMAVAGPMVDRVLTAAFAVGLSSAVGARAFHQGRRLRQENTLLFRARDVVLRMVSDLTGSAEYLVSTEATLGRILEVVQETLSARGVALFMVDKSNEALPVFRFAGLVGEMYPLHAEIGRIYGGRPAEGHSLEDAAFGVGEGVVGVCAARNRVLWFDRALHYTRMLSLGLNVRAVRNIAAAPLVVEGNLRGVVVAQNIRSRGTLDAADVHVLESIVTQAGLSLATLSLHEEVRQGERIREEMAIAANIQQHQLPWSVPELPHLRMATHMQAAKEIGGDYYDFIEYADGRLGVVIGDVSGKGLPAGMIMVIARTILHIVAREDRLPRDVVLDLSREMFPRVQRGQFMTLNFLVWDDDARSLTYAGAGHEHVLWYHAGEKSCERIRAGGMAVGLVEDSSAFITDQVLELQPADMVLLYTDGVTEARNESEDMFGLDTLQSSFERHARLGDPSEVRDAVLADVAAFSGPAEQYDDLTLLVLACR